MATVKILQGVDPIVFRRSPEGHVRPPELRGCFAVFSGGKLEFRKGQDLVLRSFKRFHDRHPDSRLVTAWHSPWPNVGESLNVLGSMTALAFNRDGVPNVTGWAHDNRVPAHAFLDLGAVPNSQMPSWLRSVDVAVFPSRAEGGTNLVAMECMASAVPVILSANTGHLDLIGDDTCLVLTRQAPVPARLTDVRSTQGWGESDVDEIVEQLELAYADRDLRKRIGARGAEHLSGQTWSSQIGKLEDQLLDMMG